MDKYKIAIVDDEVSICEMLAMFFEEKGYYVETFTDPLLALKTSKKRDFDLFIVDFSMPDISGIEFLKAIKSRNVASEVIIMSAYGTVEAVKEMFKYQVYDFVEKPFNMDEMLSLAEDALEKVSRKKELDKKRQSDEKESESLEFDENDIDVNVVGNDPLILDIVNKTKKIAKFDTTLLITGETGTGKELIANLIYANSNRVGKPFIKVNCPAIAPNLFESELFGYEKGSFTGAIKSSDGKFQAANNGIIFLDEIGDLPLDAQAKILRILQNGELSRIGSSHPVKVDVRIIAATNLDLMSLVKEGKFREDLFYRLNQVSIHLPPLRDRGDDVLLLVDYFSDYYSKKFNIEKKKIPDDIKSVLRNYPWPGNIRELSNCVNRFYVLSDQKNITYSDLPNEIRDYKGSTNIMLPTLEDVEKSYIYYLLKKTFDNKKEVASILGMDLSTLYRKISKYGLSEPKNVEKFSININSTLQFIEKTIIFYYIEYEKRSIDEVAKLLNIDKNRLKGKIEDYEIKYNN